MKLEMLKLEMLKLKLFKLKLFNCRNNGVIVIEIKFLKLEWKTEIFNNIKRSQSSAESYIENTQYERTFLDYVKDNFNIYKIIEFQY